MIYDKPDLETLQAAFEFARKMRWVADLDCNPWDVDEDGEPRGLKDDDKAEVLDALCEMFSTFDMRHLLNILQALLAPEATVVHQDADTLVIFSRQQPTEGITGKSAD